MSNFLNKLLQRNNDNIIYNKIIVANEKLVKFLCNDKTENDTQRKYLWK